MSTFDNIPFFNLPQYLNEDIPSGVSETQIYVANIYDIEKDAEIKPLSKDMKSLGDAVSITDDIVFKPGKGFTKLAIQSQTGEVKDVSEGDIGNKKHKSVFEFFMTNNNEDNLGFAYVFKNAPMIILVMEKSKRIRKIGTLISPAYMEDNSTSSGKEIGNNNGIQFTVSAATGYIAPVYKGNIALAENPNP